MRLSELLGSLVEGPDGEQFGRVTDVRLGRRGRRKGPPFELVVDSLLVSPRSAGSLFGYDRRTEQGPWLLRAVVRRLHRGAFLVPWSAVASWDGPGQRVVLTRDHERQPARPAG
jgi:sporulation protein YlmC with PRC-barrel domain